MLNKRQKESLPKWTGAIPEAFRVRKGTNRSLHPTHSVCGVGALAKELLDNHGKEYRIHGFVGWRQRYDRIGPLLKCENLRRGKVLAADADLINSRAMWEAALSAIRKAPLFFVEKIL